MADENQMDQGPVVQPRVEERAKRGVTHARKAAEDLRSAADAIAGEYRGKAEQAWDDVRARVRTFQEDADHYVRENPTKAVFTALGVGFVLGLIFRRWSRGRRMIAETTKNRLTAVAGQPRARSK
jgi:ElaB/YqjD/DUF883 family membrane-anchored ribosome-binding protein